MPILDRRVSQIPSPIEDNFNLVRGRNGSNSSQPASSGNNNFPNNNSHNNNNNQACFSCCGGSSRKTALCKEFSFENTNNFSPMRSPVQPESTSVGSYSQKEVLRNSLKNCKTCSLSIPDTSPVIQSGSNVFHTNCVKCGGCSKIMIDTHFLEDDEKICCFDCFNRIKCSVCSVELKEDYIKSGKKGFHQECFSQSLNNKTANAGESKQLSTTLDDVKTRSRTWELVYLVLFLCVFLSIFRYYFSRNTGGIE